LPEDAIALPNFLALKLQLGLAGAFEQKPTVMENVLPEKDL